MILSRLLATIGLAGVIAAGLRAENPPGGPAAGTRGAEKLAALEREHQVAESAFQKAAAALEDNAEGQQKYDELWKAFDQGQSDRFAAAVAIAKADPESDLAVAALEWVLTKPRSYTLPAGMAAMEEVTRHHAAHARVGKLAAWVGNYPPPAEHHPKEAAAAWIMLDAIGKNNPDRTTRAQAALAKASRAKAAYDVAVRSGSAATTPGSTARSGSAATTPGSTVRSGSAATTPGNTARGNRTDAERLASEADALAAAAERAYESLIREYGDSPRLIRENSGTVGELARRELYELRNLRVGKVAPEIEAEGVDGKRFKLSDHRGKVVALIFWASWCGPCMAEVPHERAMTQRLKGKPFTIVGVNGDLDRETAARVMAGERMAWPSFWNGPGASGEPGGPDGPISRAWKVRGWPTVYVLDAQGVIRFKHARDQDLEEKVNRLIGELESKK